MYEMVHGFRPFISASTVDLMCKHLTEVPAWQDPEDPYLRDPQIKDIVMRALEKNPHEEFPGATLVASTSQEGEQLQRWIDALDDYLAKDAPRPDLPLDLRGTAFQVKVWRFLLDVGEGEVISYGELAEGIGRRGSARAVASACGANRIGVLVPCHRVLCANGDLGGYRWGVERKRALLDRERRERAAR